MSDPSCPLPSASNDQFNAPGLVLAFGAACLGCMFCTAQSFAARFFADARGVAMDTTHLFYASLFFGCIVELLGFSYLIRRRKFKAAKKFPAALVVCAMVMIILPIQFAGLSLLVNHQMAYGQ